MTSPPIKIGIGGSHSTGKTTFLIKLKARLEHTDLSICHVQDLATNAQDLGFPILTQHTYDSTLWIMAEGMRRESEATLSSDVILIDRPVFDALGYFEAALEVAGRTPDTRQLKELRTISKAHLGAYDCVIGTELNPAIALGEDRDENETFRIAAANHIRTILNNEAPDALRLTSSNADEMLDRVVGIIEERYPTVPQVDM